MDNILTQVSMCTAEFDGLNISNEGFWFGVAFIVVVVGGLAVTYIVERATR